MPRQDLPGSTIQQRYVSAYVPRSAQYGLDNQLPVSIWLYNSKK